MAIYVFYHIYCIIHTDDIVKDQIKNMIFSGLYRNVDKIHCFLLGEEEHRDRIKQIIKKSGAKFCITDENENADLYERFTLQNIKNYITPEDKFLYCHSKGITRVNEDNYNNVVHWRNYMEYYLFTYSTQIIKALDDFDVAGTIYRRDNVHFAGNFWWCTGKHYLSLPREIGLDYLDPEFYVCKNSPKILRIDNDNFYPNCYIIEYPFGYYIDK